MMPIARILRSYVLRALRRLLRDGRGGQRHRDLHRGGRADDGQVPPGVQAGGGVRRLDVGDGGAPDGRRPLQVQAPLRHGQRRRGGLRARKGIVLGDRLKNNKFGYFDRKKRFIKL